MSSITDRIEQLSETRGQIGDLRRAAEELPDDLSLQINIQSLENRERKISNGFAVNAANRWVDVVDYRLFKQGGNNPFIKAVAGAMATFQNAFTVVYDAITTKPKLRASSGAAAVAATSLQLAYSYDGSVGLVLSLPNERLLLDDSNLDRAMGALFSMVQARSSDQIAEFSRTLGPAAVSALYKWGKALADDGIGAELGWQKGEEIRSRVTVQPEDLQELLQAISETSDEKTETIPIEGTLIGSDTNQKGERSFHFKQSGSDREIRGKMAWEIGVVETPQYYLGQLRVTQSVNYATEQVNEEFYMLSLSLSTPPEQEPSSLVSASSQPLLSVMLSTL